MNICKLPSAPPCIIHRKGQRERGGGKESERASRAPTLSSPAGVLLLQVYFTGTLCSFSGHAKYCLLCNLFRDKSKLRCENVKRMWCHLLNMPAVRTGSTGGRAGRLGPSGQPCTCACRNLTPGNPRSGDELKWENYYGKPRRNAVTWPGRLWKTVLPPEEGVSS